MKLVEFLSFVAVAKFPTPGLQVASSCWNWVSNPLHLDMIRVSLHELLVSGVLPFVHTFWLLGCVAMAIATKAVIWMSRKIPKVARSLNQERVEKEPITLIGEVAAAVVFVAVLVIGY
jgi:hypothetical protein